MLAGIKFNLILFNLLNLHQIWYYLINLFIINTISK
jgi:hypothetical protein